MQRILLKPCGWFYKKKLSYNQEAIAVINMSKKAKIYSVAAKDFGLAEGTGRVPILTGTPIPNEKNAESIASHATLVYILNYSGE